MTPNDKRDLRRKVNNALKTNYDISNITMYANALKAENPAITFNVLVDKPHILIDFMRTTSIKPLPKYNVGEVVAGLNEYNGVVSIIKGTVSRYNTVKVVIRYEVDGKENFKNFPYSCVYRDMHVLLLDVSKLIN